MAAISVMAGRFELGVRMVSPNICGFHTSIPILAIGHRVAWQASHKGHLPKSPARVFDKVELWPQFPDEREDVGIHFVTKLCIVTDGV